MQGSGTLSSANKERQNELGLARLISSSRFWPIQQDNRPKLIEDLVAESPSKNLDRGEPDQDRISLPEIKDAAEERIPEPPNDRRLRYIEERHKNGILEQKLEALAAQLKDMTKQRDSWQSQAERSLAAFHEIHQDFLRLVKVGPSSLVAKQKKGLFNLFKKSV